MSRHRRHAEDFTDSLNSLPYTSNSDIYSDACYSMSQDSLDEVKATKSHKFNDATRSSKHSIILAGSSTKNSLILNTPNSFVTPMEPAPDLNKRIDLFQSENLREQHQSNVEFTCSHKEIVNKENSDPQFVMADKQLENEISKTMKKNLTSPILKKNPVLPATITSTFNTMSESSKRDTNHNINNNNSDVHSTSEESTHKLTKELELVSSSTDINKDTYISDNHSKNKQTSDELKKFESILYFLDNQLNQIKEVSQPQQILKNLSDKYVDSPENFTERLLTIIEESVINNDDDVYGNSAINLSRLTTEFKKMCKFIEDEATPEWPLSPLCTPPCSEQTLANFASNKSASTIVHKNEKSATTFMNATSLPSTPLSGTDIIKRRFFQKISKHNYSGSTDNVTNFSPSVSGMDSFERLEIQCKRLFPEENECFHPLRKSLSVPSLLSMSQIQNICEDQMASLNISNINNEKHKKKTVVSNSNLLDMPLQQSSLANKLDLNCAKLHLRNSNFKKNFQQKNLSYSKTKSIKSNKEFDSNKLNVNKMYDYMAFDPDELEKTLLQDIAEKRKRCLDTARLITEINADPVVIEDKSSTISSMSTTGNESSSLSYDEAQFLKTLTSCRNYKTYLEKKKPLFKFLCESSPLSTPKSMLKDNEDIHSTYKRINNSKKESLIVQKSPRLNGNIVTPNVQPCNRYKSSLSKKKDEKNKENVECIKPKLFVTPGKSPPNANYKKKKLFFPSMNSPRKNTPEHILKSPHAEGLYRLNYNTIISPVGMYIRGTDLQLIKNVHAKRDDQLLSSAKKDIKTTPYRSSKETPLSKGITKTQKKISRKIELSSPLETNRGSKQEVITPKTPEITSTPKSHFVLPKVSYKLPLHVKTIKENNTFKTGTRVKKLLEAAESRVVIRHQGRTNSIKKKETMGTSESSDIVEINYEPEDESIHVEQAATKTNYIHKQKTFNLQYN
ncbi:uncharacterized protein LOC143180116 [Calliopsis andreniformis]|uniref:uncharacterized protein LOC143180116 n=1 Tax=Calliopsis andreniformis TaxID=337506 RepID=UPI003FCD0C0B